MAKRKWKYKDASILYLEIINYEEEDFNETIMRALHDKIWPILYEKIIGINKNTKILYSNLEANKYILILEDVEDIAEIAIILRNYFQNRNYEGDATILYQRPIDVCIAIHKGEVLKTTTPIFQKNPVYYGKEILEVKKLINHNYFGRVCASDSIVKIIIERESRQGKERRFHEQILDKKHNVFEINHIGVPFKPYKVVEEPKRVEPRRIPEIKNRKIKVIITKNPNDQELYICGQDEDKQRECTVQYDPLCLIAELMIANQVSNEIPHIIELLTKLDEKIGKFEENALQKEWNQSDSEIDEIYQVMTGVDIYFKKLELVYKKEFYIDRKLNIDKYMIHKKDFIDQAAMKELLNSYSNIKKHMYKKFEDGRSRLDYLKNSPDFRDAYNDYHAVFSEVIGNLSDLSRDYRDKTKSEIRKSLENCHRTNIAVKLQNSIDEIPHNAGDLPDPW